MGLSSILEVVFGFEFRILLLWGLTLRPKVKLPRKEYVGL